VVSNDIEFKADKIKNNIRKHKTLYCSCASSVIVAGITVLIMRSNIARGEMSRDNARGELINAASFIFRNKQTLNITTVLDRESRGHPGWPVRNLETKRIFFSIIEAAHYFDVPVNVLYGHLKGKFQDVDGLHFERINLVPKGE
jgi:hypothetical protein